MGNKNQTKRIKPFPLEHEEAKLEMANAVNRANTVHGVPFVFIEDILTVLLYQAKENAKIEREMAKQTYEKQMEEYLKAEKEEEREE